MTDTVLLEGREAVAVELGARLQSGPDPRARRHAVADG